MRYSLVTCDVPDCNAENTAPYADGNLGWAFLQGVALTDNTGKLLAPEIVLCPACKDRVRHFLNPENR